MLTSYLMISLLIRVNSLEHQCYAYLLITSWIWRPLEDHRMKFLFKTAFTVFPLRSGNTLYLASQREWTDIITFHSCSGPESPKESLMLSLYIISLLSIEQGEVSTGRVVIKYTRTRIYNLDFQPHLIIMIELSNRRCSINTCWLRVWYYSASLWFIDSL